MMVWMIAFWNLCKWRMKEFFREPTAFYWVILMPVFWMLVLGFLMDRRSGENVYSIFVSFPQSEMDTLIEPIERLNRSSEFVVHTSRLRELERTGELDLILHFSACPEESMDPICYQVGVDRSRQESLLAFYKVKSLLHTKADAQNWRTSEIHSAPYSHFLIPGLLALSLLTTSLFGNGMTLVVNRRDAILKRLLVTPMPKSFYLLSFVYGRLFILCFELASVLVFAYFLLQFKLHGLQILQYLVMAVLGAFAFTSLAFLLASRTKNVGTVTAFSNLLVFLFVVFGGVFFSTEVFPLGMQQVLQYLPMNLLCQSLRDIYASTHEVVIWNRQTAYLGCYGLVFFGLARRAFKWF